MFSEILKIIPRLSNADANDMEKRLNARFGRVAKRFGKGLLQVVKGSVIGISLGLLAKLLNPLEALEEKIKTLLGQGSDLRDLADRFGTSPGAIKRLQDVSESVGVSPEQLNELMTKYAQAIEKAREELADPTKELSASTNAVKNFVDQSDLAESFFSFLQSLKAEGQGAGREVELAKGIAKQLSGLESRKAFEKEIFGETLTGGARRLVEADFPSEFKRIGEPNSTRLDKAIEKYAKLADQERAGMVAARTNDFLRASGMINSKMISDMVQSEKNRMDRETKQLESYADLKKAALAIDKVIELFEQLHLLVNKAIGYLADIASSIAKIKDSPWWRRIFGA